MPESELAAIGRQMGEAIGFRGPDDTGIWADPAIGLTFSHRRLSILDLSPEGHQPMISESGRFIMIYNGEIYNFETIQEELGTPGRHRSDTRVILAAFERWGIGETIKKLNGIFALALWDKKERQLTLVRDRLGIKPLYYGWQSKGGRQTFLFGSDTLAFRPHPNFLGDEDSTAISNLLRFGFIPAPTSIYEGVYKLIPGKILTLNEGELRSKPSDFHAQLPLQLSYFDLLKEKRDHVSATTAVDETVSVLRSAVKRQLIADVPVGAFLSGGIDSSLVVAMMREVTSQVSTFSIGFETDGYDESATAARIAEILGTKHTKFYLTEREVLDQVPDVLSKLGEPFGDPSIIPTALVSKLAREHVTVALSGDGGDELFGGYNRYLFPAQVWKLRHVPRPLRSLMLSGLKTTPRSLTGRILGLNNVTRLTDRLEKVNRMLVTKDIHAAYLTLMECNEDVANPEFPPALSRALLAGLSQPEDTWMLFDQLFYLADDNLCKVDRASMAHSLEVRTPLLDNEVLAFSHRVPLELKLHRGQTKWILRQALLKYLPSDIIDLPKTGFTPPIAHWLRGPLKSWGADLLNTVHDLPGLRVRSQRDCWARLQSQGKPADAALMWNLLTYWDWRRRTQ